ncbi:MAG: efflux RND transporter permease subunit, partial [Verrucomicrobiota bacterium]
MQDSASKPNRLATLFLENRHLLVLFIMVTVVAGISAIQSLPRLEDPVITNRNPQVITLFPGATAERVEALVTEKIEQELKEIPEIKNIDTTSQAAVSVVAIELADEVTIESNEQIFSEIRDKLADAAAQFPEGVLPPDFDDKRNAVAYTLIVSLAWEDRRENTLGLINRLGEELADQLRAVSGTELVRMFGEPEEEIAVMLDEAEFTALGLTAGDLAAALRQADAKIPSG